MDLNNLDDIMQILEEGAEEDAEDARNIDELTNLLESFDEEVEEQSRCCRSLLAHFMAPWIAVPIVPPAPLVPSVPAAFFRHTQSCRYPKHDPQPLMVAAPIVSIKSRPSRGGALGKQWTAEETESLRQGMELFGEHKHRWALIKQHFSKELHHRSNIDLKDRWRNMQGRKQNRKRKARKPACVLQSSKRRCKQIYVLRGLNPEV